MLTAPTYNKRHRLVAFPIIHGFAAASNISLIAIRDLPLIRIDKQGFLLQYCISRYAIRCVMRTQSQHLKPQDVLLLLKIVSNNSPSWNQKPGAVVRGVPTSL